MTHKEQLEILAKVRGWGGAVSFHPEGKVVLYSRDPLYSQVKLAFPNCEIESEGPLVLDTTIYRYQITFIPDRYVKPAAVLRFATHG